MTARWLGRSRALLAGGLATLAPLASAQPPRLSPSTAAPILRLDLSPEAQQALATSRKPLDARQTLAGGLVIELSGPRSMMVRLTAVLLGSRASDLARAADGHTASSGESVTWISAPFALHAGSTSLPGPDFVPLPSSGSAGDGVTSFEGGDRFLRAERPIRADRYARDVRRIASTGVVFGDTKVDLERQTVLYLVVVPVAAEEAAATLVVPVAFILNAERGGASGPAAVGSLRLRSKRRAAPLASPGARPESFTSHVHDRRSR